MYYVRECASHKLSESEIELYEVKIKNYILGFIKKHYPEYLKLFKKVPISISNELTGTTLGKFIKYQDNFLRLEFYSHGLKPSILLDKFNKYCREVVLHETLHMVTYLMGEPYSDGDYFFEALLLKHQSVSSDKSKNPSAKTISIPTGQYVYSCCCGLQFSKELLDRTTCGKCSDKLLNNGFYINKKNYSKIDKSKSILRTTNP